MSRLLKFSGGSSDDCGSGQTSHLEKPLGHRNSQFTKLGAVAVVLSGVGLYSAIAHAFRRRTAEIAIRMALGARAGHVHGLFVSTGAWVVAGGLVLKLPASVMVGRLLQNNVVRTVRTKA